jgi:hypothetical protein
MEMNNICLTGLLSTLKWIITLPLGYGQNQMRLRSLRRSSKVLSFIPGKSARTSHKAGLYLLSSLSTIESLVLCFFWLSLMILHTCLAAFQENCSSLREETIVLSNHKGMSTLTRRICCVPEGTQNPIPKEKFPFGEWYVSTLKL